MCIRTTPMFIFFFMHLLALGGAQSLSSCRSAFRQLAGG